MRRLLPHTYAPRVKEIIRANGWLMHILHTVRGMDLPDWYVAAGAVRSVVWDRLHGYQDPTPVHDVDVIFFDQSDLSHDREKEIEHTLHARIPGMEWDVKNQAAVHLWYPAVFGYGISPRESSEDAIRMWSPSSIGVRLLPNGGIRIAAPNGLSDLYNMKFRGNPAIPKELFIARATERRIKQKWPLVEIIEE